MSAATKATGSIRGDSITRHCVLLVALDLAFDAATRFDATLEARSEPAPSERPVGPDGAVTDVRLALRGPLGALFILALLFCLPPSCLLLFVFAAVLAASSFL